MPTGAPPVPELRLDPSVAGARFSPIEFSWEWWHSQLIARSSACSLADPLDRPRLLPSASLPAHPLIAFNGALLARNRAEVMDRLIGGYDNWQGVGRWGSCRARFLRPLANRGRARVTCGFSETGSTSKGHGLARFVFEVTDLGGEPLADGWMLLFLLGCGSPALGRIESPAVALPDRPADEVVAHETPINVTFDWAMPSDDWNTTHFEAKGGNPAPLVHGPRNMAMIINDAARLYAGGEPSRVRDITLGSLTAPHFPGEVTETHLWRADGRRLLARLLVPAASRLDGGAGDKVVIDQIEIEV
jgi:hypothetical protein